MEHLSQVSTRNRPDRGYSWIVLLFAFFICFITDGLNVSFSNTLVNIIKADPSMHEIAGFSGSIRITFMFLSGPLVASLVNRYGSGEVIVGGAVLSSLVYLLNAIIPSIWFIIFCYGIVGGISYACVFVPSMIVIIEYFEKRKGLATGLAMSGSSIGAFVFAHKLGQLTALVGWRWSSFIDALIILFVAVFGLLIIWKKKTKPIEIEFEAYESSECLVVCILKDAYSLDLLRKNLGLTLMVFSNFCLFFGMMTPYIHFWSMVNDSLMGVDDAFWMIKLSIIADIPLRILYGHLADVKFLTPVKLNSLAILISTFGLGFFLLTRPTVDKNFFFSLIFTSGTAGLNCLAMIYACYLVGVKNSSRAFGALMMARGVGYALGLICSRTVINKTGVTAPWILISLAFFIIALIFSGIVSFLAEFRNCLNRNKSSETSEPVVDRLESIENEDLRIDSNQQLNDN